MQDLKFTSADIDDLGKTGIYAIVNKVNGKFYVGSAARVKQYKSKSGFYIRWKEHLKTLRFSKHHSRYLQNAWNKYGEENFEFRILHFCPPEECIQFEQIYLNLLCPHYNISPTAGSTLGVKHSEETKNKNSEAQSQPFSIISPEGELIEGKNLRRLARENDLNHSHLAELFKDKYLHAEGWTKDLDCHKLYLEYYKERGLVYQKSVGTWRCGVKSKANPNFPRKSFKTKEEAILYRDLIEASGYKFKVQSLNWKEKLKDAKQQEQN
jgi:group I intron endonuclease